MSGYGGVGASHVITLESDRLREACFKLLGDFLTQLDEEAGKGC